MKWVLTSIFLLIKFVCFAQVVDTATSNQIDIQYPVRGYIIESNGNQINMVGLSWIDSMHVRVFSQGTNKIGGVYTYKGDPRTITSVAIPITSIKIIKINKDAFFEGAVVGGFIGGALGYATGYVSYDNDIYRTHDQNNESRKSRAVVGALIGAVPAALVGGLTGGIFTKKRYRVNGQAERLRSALRKF